MSGKTRIGCDDCGKPVPAKHVLFACCDECWEKTYRHQCACGIPGPGKERECHGDYYDGETFAIDPGGEFKETNVCLCGCHRHAAAVSLGRKGGKAGTGEAKRRGDSAYYKALRAKRNVKAGGGLGGGT